MGKRIATIILYYSLAVEQARFGVDTRIMTRLMIFQLKLREVRLLLERNSVLCSFGGGIIWIQRRTRIVLCVPKPSLIPAQLKRKTLIQIQKSLRNFYQMGLYKSCSRWRLGLVMDLGPSHCRDYDFTSHHICSTSVLDHKSFGPNVYVADF